MSAEKLATMALSAVGANSILEPAIAPSTGGQEKTLVLPCGGTMSEFETSLFSDLDNLRFVEVILSTSSINPVSIGIEYTLQLTAFVDMVQDINGNSESLQRYFDGFSDFGRKLVTDWSNFSKESTFIGFNVLFDPRDAVLPVDFANNNSMSILNQLTYKVSVDRIMRLSSSVEWRGSDLWIRYVV